MAASLDCSAETSDGREVPGAGGGVLLQAASSRQVHRTVDLRKVSMAEDGSGSGRARAARDDLELLAQPAMGGVVVHALVPEHRGAHVLQRHRRLEHLQLPDRREVPSNALVGETMARWAHARGVAGFVVDGAVRDLDDLRHGPLPVYSRSVSPRGPTRTGGGEVYGEVGVGGAVVRAGDLVVGDVDGVVFVPQAQAQAAGEACLQLMARERETFEAIRRGTLSRAWIAQVLRPLR